MSQHAYISQELLQDPCLRFMSYSILIIRLCGPAQATRKFWPPETRFVWPCAGKTVRPRSAGAFRAGETQILSSGDAFCVALRRENSRTECFAQTKRKFSPAETHFLWPCAGETQIWPPETHLLSRWVDSRGVTTKWTKIATALQRDAKKNSGHTFRAGETQILTSGVAFSVALRSKKRGGQKKAPRPKRLYPYRKNPSVWHTVWGKNHTRLFRQSFFADHSAVILGPGLTQPLPTPSSRLPPPPSARSSAGAPRPENATGPATPRGTVFRPKDEPVAVAIQDLQGIWAGEKNLSYP